MNPMTKMLIAALMALPLFGQTPAPVPVPTYPSNWIGAGIGYGKDASPRVNGWVSYASLVTQKGPVYSYSSIDVSNIKGKSISQTTIRTGVATTLKTIGPVIILGFATAGVSSTSSIGGAFSGGGTAMYRFASGWTVEVVARVAKTNASATQMVYEAGIGHVF